MRVVKRRKLLQRGWAVGDAGDFLGLTAEEQALVELHLRLANGLKLQRVQRRLTQGELARAVRSSQDYLRSQTGQYARRVWPSPLPP